MATAFFYNLVQQGRLIDSTGVTPAQPSKVFVIPVERTAAVNTGMAFRSVPERLELSLYDGSGNLIETTTASGEAKFIDQFFTAVPEEFSGSVQAESSSNFFVTVLRLEFIDDGFQLTSIPATSVPSLSFRSPEVIAGRDDDTGCWDGGTGFLGIVYSTPLGPPIDPYLHAA